MFEKKGDQVRNVVVEQGSFWEEVKEINRF
jgi:hypothetical protein